MSDLATLIAQLSGSNQQPSSDPAMAAVKLARASIDALVLKLGQTIDAKVVGQLAAGLTQLSAGTENFVLKLETPLPAGTAVTASKQRRMAYWLVSWPTCTAMWATSSMSPEPSEYQGSMTQSWPKATRTPAAASSATRVSPRRLG